MVTGEAGDPRPVQGPGRREDPHEAAGDHLRGEPRQAQQGHPPRTEGRKHQQMPHLSQDKGTYITYVYVYMCINVMSTAVVLSLQ